MHRITDPAILYFGTPVVLISTDEWRPLIMSFQRFYGLTGEQAGGSRLAEIPEESYRRNGRPPVGATRSH